MSARESSRVGSKADVAIPVAHGSLTDAPGSEAVGCHALAGSQ
jgi:hypothetical protein